MLSRKVEVKVIVKSVDEKYHSFDFLLDRKGQTTKELAPKVEMAWEGFQSSTKEIDYAYNEDEYNTSFKYVLEESEQKETVSKGVVEFLLLIPYQNTRQKYSSEGHEIIAS